MADDQSVARRRLTSPGAMLILRLLFLVIIVFTLNYVVFYVDIADVNLSI
ncbi:hypothetical protein [Microvirga sp. TS319]